MRTTTRFIPAGVLGTLLAATGAAPEALAHDATHEITGKALKVDTSKTPVGHKFSFKAVKDPGIFPQHDPAAQGAAQRECLSGPNQGVACNGNDAFCDSNPGAGDGSCDACPVVGGVTTEDEMFILIGSHY